MKNNETKYEVRRRLINFIFQVNQTSLVEEFEVIMPDDAQAITGVLVSAIIGTKSTTKMGDVHISCEHILGSFFSTFPVNYTSNNSGFTNAAVATSPYPRKTSPFRIYVPVTGGDKIKIVFDNANYQNGVIMPSQLQIAFEYEIIKIIK